MAFSDNFLTKIIYLPNELTDIIFSYIPTSISVFLNKANYIKYHKSIKKYINKGNIENYIRCMVRQDNDFVLKQLLNENFNLWINMKKYYYKTCIYTDYISFIESYAIDNESTKCKQAIYDFFKELGLSKNQHKKNICKYIRWKT